jgi:integrase
MQKAVMSVLRSCLNWGVQHEYLEESPYKNMPRATTSKRDRVLTPSEITKLWSHLKPILKFTLLTGQRVGEVVAMKWQDLEVGEEPEQEHNEPQRFPSVRWTQPDNKTGVPHVLGLPQLAVAQLDLESNNNTKGHVYTSSTTHVGFSSIRAVGFMFHNALSKSGVEHCTVHDLRRTALTNIARLMQSGEAAERVANHALGDVASRYNLYSFEDLKAEALMKWSGYVEQLVWHEHS